MKTVTLPVSALEVCDRTRVRHQKPKDGTDIILEYAEAYQCGLILEPLDVFREKGTERYIVADGEHRLLALRRAKIKEVECRLHEGDEVDALDFAIRCNRTHGVRRTKADIYHAFKRIKETPRLRDKYRTDTELSEQLGISIRTVKSYGAEWRNSDGGDARVRAQKEKAQERAATHAPKAGNVQVARSKDTQNQQATKNQLASRAVAAATPAAEVAETPDWADIAAWTDADEATYAALRNAWNAATSAARDRFLDEITE